ncbi:MAG TPA: efflux RND transporter periplasmic adaptor subunit [Verrucomicrobiae bacterium]|nr:efflux RND transporter periplasmic adaptor subunit [Verrucomicrobiae bacterium]
MRTSVNLILIALLLILTGCGHKHEAGDGHSHDKDGHGHAEESPSGASFKPNQGVLVTDETRKILDLQTAEVAEQKLPAQIRFNLQVFGEKHHHALQEADHTGCDVHGSGFLPPDKVTSVRAGQPVQVQTRDNTALTGAVLAVEPALALGETEIIVGLTNATHKVKPGEFLSAVITQPRDNTVMVIPRSALLRTAEGTFVYTVNGDAYMRTAVRIGTEADGKLEITDGLSAGDSVVTKPVETLWLVELRATKGGGHSH